MSEILPSSECPGAATLRALLDGTLPDDQQAATQAHVDRCPTCEAALRQMTAGGESWIGMAEKLKSRGGDAPKLTAALERLKADDGSVDESSEPAADPQRTLDFLQPTDDPKLLGKLGQHEISEVVGWGGMGVVLKAYDPSLHRVVAVKVLASHLAHHAVARKRFIREAQAAAAVCHDNVITIHAIDESGPQPKIVMQFVAGGSLQERIDQEGPLELKEILRIAMQTASGLAAAHAQGVVHRDVKPANILLENGVQRVKLTDFGLARVMDDASLTLSGVIAGTPQYMAPEQAWGRDVDARADLFSLGAVMYAMCSGHSPFRARTTMAVLKRVCEDAPRPLRAINPDIPDWLVAIIEKLLAKNPDERFQTATEVSELLSRWLAHVQQPSVVERPEPISARRGSPDPTASPDRRSPVFLGDSNDEGDLRPRLGVGSRDPRTAQVAAPSVVTFARVWMPLLLISAVAALVVVEELRMLSVLREQTGVTRWRWRFVEPIGIALAHILTAACSYGAFYVGWNTIGGRQRLAMCIVLAAVIWSFIGAIEHLRQPYSFYFWPQVILCGGYLLAIVVRHVSQHGQEMLLLPGVGHVSQPDSNASNNVDCASGQPGEANLRTDETLSTKAALLPMLGVGTTVAIVLLLIVAAGETNNLLSFLGFAAWNLLATFAICSVFRTAWNTSSWLTWIGTVVLLPAVGSGFLLASSYQPTPTAPVLIFAVQSLTAFALLFGLLFVRPFFVRGSERWMSERLSGWQRLFAIACFTIFGTPLALAMIYLLSYASSEPTSRFRGPEPDSSKVLVVPTDKPGTPDRNPQGFPKPQFLSADGAPGVPIVPPSNSQPPASLPDALKPLQGRWVVLTLQGDEPPQFSGQGGGAPGPAAMGGFGQSASAAATPRQFDQLRFLEFRGQSLLLNDDDERDRMDVSVRNGRELSLAAGGGQPVWHGVFTVEGDRLVICWTSANVPLPRDFRPKPNEQLVVCRREWAWPSKALPDGNAEREAIGETTKLPKAEMPFSPREAAALQAAWAEKLKSPVEVVNSIGMKLRVVPPGSSGNARESNSMAGLSSGGAMAGASSMPGSMGGARSSTNPSESGLAMNGPILVGMHEVTVAQFRQFIDDSKYVTEAERSENGQPANPHSWRKPEIEQDSDQHPVVHVSIADAVAFCHWLSLKEKKPYRLLTRAEWEFCARAGSWLPATLGPGKLAFRSQFFTTTAPVGSYSANPFGLHDFIGNVAEWAWHNDIVSENDPRRSAPDTGIWTGDPTVFCGGDFRQHIERSQPSEWLHPVATKTPPMIGFRVACDLTAASVVSLPKHWPMDQLFLSQELVRVRTLSDSDAKSDANKADAEKTDAPATQPAGKLINAVWLEMLVRAEQMPYAVEWLDFEIERRTTPANENISDFAAGKIEDAGPEVGWKPIDLAPAMRLLEQTEFAPDPIAAPFVNSVLTMPIPKAVSGRWASPDKRGGLPPNFVRLEPAIQKPQLFRFLDFDTPHGRHHYRVRLKYCVPGLVPETVQTTSWFLSMSEVNNDLDSVDRELPENIPVIEFKPPMPVDPSAPPIDGPRYRVRRRPATSSPSN